MQAYGQRLNTSNDNGIGFPNFEAINFGFLEAAFLRPGVFTNSIRGLLIGRQINDKIRV